MENRAVLERYLDVDRVAVLRTARGDGRIVDNFDLAGKGKTCGIRHHRLRELIDEAIALEEEGRCAVRQIELGGSKALRDVLPPHIIDGGLRSAHDDSPDVVRAKRVFTHQLPQRVERRVIARYTGVELQGDAHRLPYLSEASDELAQLEAVARGRKGRTESAVVGLQADDE